MCKDIRMRLTDILQEWLKNFENPKNTHYALEASMSFASQAILNQAIIASDTHDARYLYTNPGTLITRIRLPIPAMVSLTAVILIQLAGLFAVAFYAYKPTWTKNLDSFAMLRLGASMMEGVPLISAIESKEVEGLNGKEGWIGAVGGGNGKGSARLVIGGELPLDAKIHYRIDRDLD